jgi:hypothetical protein
LQVGYSVATSGMRWCSVSNLCGDVGFVAGLRGQRICSEIDFNPLGLHLRQFNRRPDWLLADKTSLVEAACLFQPEKSQQQESAAQQNEAVLFGTKARIESRERKNGCRKGEGAIRCRSLRESLQVHVK